MLSHEENSSSTDSGSSPQRKIVNPETRRLHQNRLEQQRRNAEHESFVKLNNSLPTPQTSRKEILENAIEYINGTAPQLPSCLLDIDKYTKENRWLQKQIKVLEEAKARGDMNSCQNIFKDVKQLDPADTDSEEDAEELESTNSNSDCEDADETVLMKKRPATSYPSDDEQSIKSLKLNASGESEDDDGASWSLLWNTNLVHFKKMPGESDDETSVANNNSCEDITMTAFDFDGGIIKLDSFLNGEFEEFMF